jgi:hypothetical protein
MAMSRLLFWQARECATTAAGLCTRSSYDRRMAIKTYTLEVQRYKAAASTHGLVNVKFDALLVPRNTPDGQEPSHMLSMSEADARTLMLLLKAQLSEFDKKKARSQR